jgi:hypothetical protein
MSETYYCTRCEHHHKYGSNIGSRHLGHKELENVPEPDFDALAMEEPGSDVSVSEPKGAVDGRYASEVVDGAGTEKASVAVPGSADPELNKADIAQLNENQQVIVKKIQGLSATVEQLTSAPPRDVTIKTGPWDTVVKYLNDNESITNTLNKILDEIPGALRRATKGGDEEKERMVKMWNEKEAEGKMQRWRTFLGDVEGDKPLANVDGKVYVQDED